MQVNLKQIQLLREQPVGGGQPLKASTVVQDSWAGVAGDFLLGWPVKHNLTMFWSPFKRLVLPTSMKLNLIAFVIELNIFLLFSDMGSRGGIDSGMVVVIFISLMYLTIVFGMLFYVKNDWCDLLFKNFTESIMKSDLKLFRSIFSWCHLLKCNISIFNFRSTVVFPSQLILIWHLELFYYFLYF